MRYRKLRIAWSVVCGIMCLLLIVLWVRSYYFNDTLYLELSKSRCLVLDSVYGRFSFGVYPRSIMPPNVSWWLGNSELEPGLQLLPTTTTKFVATPGWSLILVGATLAVFPWMYLAKRFSLRTLLIAMTLAAVGLGIVAVSMR